MTIFLSKLIATILLPITMLAGLIAPQQDVNNLGATGNEIPTTVGLFETTLASAISSSATSFNLTSATYNNGASTLASSTYMFVINEGTSVQEFILADCNGVNCSNAIRGIDRLTGTTTVASLQFSHRRGSSVKITDASLLQISRILNGIGKLPNKLTYQTQPSITSDEDIATKKYADDLSYNGSPDASTIVKGIVEIATTAEVIAGTELGTTGAYLSIPVSLATSSNDVATTHIPVTDTDGKLDQSFLDLTEDFTFSGDNTFSGTTTLATTTLNGVTYVFPTSEGASSTSLTTDGSGNLSWQYPYYYYPTVASANTKISLDTATTTNLATLIKARTAYVNASGKMRISVDLKNADGSTYTEARIYINDVAVGAAQQVVGTNFVTKSQDLFVRTGDEVSVYFKTENPQFTATLQNFRIKYDRTATTSEGYMITN